MRRLAILATLLLASTGWGQGLVNRVVLPAKVTATVGGDLTEIKAVTDAEFVSWSGIGLKVYPQYKPGSGKAESVLFATPKKGVFYVIASISRDKLAPVIEVSEVTVGDGTPEPPDPGPGPKPPDPKPPSNPIAKAVLDAVAAYPPSPQRTASAQKLATAYRQVASIADSDEESKLFTSCDEFLALLRRIVGGQVKDDEFVFVRRALADELNKIPSLSSLTKPFDAQPRKDVSAALKAASEALESIK